MNDIIKYKFYIKKIRKKITKKVKKPKGIKNLKLKNGVGKKNQKIKKY